MTDPITWLDQAEARTNAATDGPWHIEPGLDEFGDDGIPLVLVTGDGLIDAPIPRSDTDAVFIAAARTDLPRAIGALRAVLDLADMWDSRADHDLVALQAFPAEVQEALYDGAWDMKHKASYIRAAITTALSMSTDDLTTALRIAGQCRTLADPSRNERAIIALANEADRLRAELARTEQQIHEDGGFIDRIVDLEAERDAARAALGRVTELRNLWTRFPDSQCTTGDTAHDLTRALEGES